MRLISGNADSAASLRLSEADHREGWRLACRCSVSGDAVFLVPAAASAFKSDIRTADISSPEELSRYEKAVAAIFSSGLTPDTEAGFGAAVDIGVHPGKCDSVKLGPQKSVGLH